MTSVHLTNAYHPSSGGVRTVYHALLAGAERLARPVRLIVPGSCNSVQDVGAFGRIYTVKAPPAFACDSRYRVILPHRYLLGLQQGITEILRAEQPDVVEICDKLSLFYVAGLLRKGWMSGIRRPVLVGVSAERFDNNVGAFVSRGRPAQRLAQMYMRHIYTPQFDYHVANSTYTADELRAALPPHRQRVVYICPPGVNDDVFDVVRGTGRDALLARVGGRPESTLLFCAGRLSPEKNPALLLDTLQHLVAGDREQQRDYRLVIAGDGPLLAELRDAAARRAPGRVTFVGNVSDRAVFCGLLGAADVFLHPNPREPFGIAPLEAMAAGVPVVLPDAGGVLTYASPDTAWLAAPRPDAFAAAVGLALDQPAVTAAKVARARLRAAQFRLTDLIDRTFRLYDHFVLERKHHDSSDWTHADLAHRDRVDPVARRGWSAGLDPHL